VLVTGGTKGVGAAVVLALREAGASVRPKEALALAGSAHVRRSHILVPPHHIVGGKWCRCNGVTSEGVTVLLRPGPRWSLVDREDLPSGYVASVVATRYYFLLLGIEWLAQGRKSTSACCAVTSAGDRSGPDVTVLRPRR